MKYVYVVTSYDASFGCDIEFIFTNLKSAKHCVEVHNSTAPSYDQWFYDRYPVFKTLKEGEDYIYAKEKTYDEV